ncbi:MAG TPA: hypothetical protein VHF69_12610, partial [Candidatus Synoicihabitans sp.]|nr:hypothetical protein [Candidatus Synoicihabitans sp.]
MFVSRRPFSRITLVLLPTVAALLGGCGDKTVSYYEVPREHTAAANPHAATAPMAGNVPTPARPPGPQLEWDKPANWTEQPGSQMRLASYAFTADDGSKADISVTAFPDAAGGLVANINRWRGQVGL